MQWTMHDQQTAIPPLCARAIDRSIALLTSSTLPQIQTASEWLTTHPYPSLDLEIALNLVLQRRIIIEETGERVALSLRATKSFAYTPITDEFSPNTIWGVVMASSNNANAPIQI